MAVLILMMLTMVVAGGTGIAVKVYRSEKAYSESRVLANTVLLAMTEELRYASGLTIGEDGAVTYGMPVALSGSVSLSLDANGEPENFYADGIAYYVINNNMGYDGDLELALIP